MTKCALSCASLKHFVVEGAGRGVEDYDIKGGSARDRCQNEKK